MWQGLLCAGCCCLCFTEPTLLAAAQQRCCEHKHVALLPLPSDPTAQGPRPGLCWGPKPLGPGPWAPRCRSPVPSSSAPGGQGGRRQESWPRGTPAKPAWELLIQGRNEAGAELSIWRAD